MAVEFSLFGHVDARVDGAAVDLGHARQRCVLATLLVDVNRLVPPDVLIDRVWGGRPPKRARNALAGYISRLRAVFAGAPSVSFERRPEGYVLGVDKDAVDLHRFHRLVAEARAEADDGRRAELLDAALGLWRGEPFARLEAPWLAAVRTSLDAQRLAATLDRNDVALRLGRHALLLGHLSDLAEEHPLDERLAAQLVLALYRSGRQADALRRVESVRVRLADELGTDPGPELRELHQRMLKADPALMVSPPPASETGPVPRQLPAPPWSFVGRTREVAQLDAAIQATNDASAPRLVIHVISGPPGVGKTTLALHWAHSAADRFIDGQLYVNLRGFDLSGVAMTPTEALGFLLESLGVPAQRVPATIEAQSALYRSLLADRRMLVVLDNARDVDQVRPLLPGNPACVVVVTSRTVLAGLVVADGARPLTLDLLSETEGRDLLAARIGRDAVEMDPGATNDVIARCTGLPLALAIVAARLAAHADLTLKAVAADLGVAADALEALAEAEPAADLATVFSWSYAALSPAAARLFRRLGRHPGPEIGLPAAASLDGSATGVRTTMAELTRANLVSEVAPERFVLHDLLHAYAAQRALVEDDDVTRRIVTERMLDHYLHTGYAAAVAVHPHRHLITLAPPVAGARVGTFECLEPALAWFRGEHEVLLAVVALADRERFDRHTWQLAWTLTDYLDRHGYWHQLLSVQQAALAAGDRLGDVFAQAATHRAIGRVWCTLGHLEESARHQQRALDLCVELGDRASQGHAHLGLSWVNARQGNLADAIRHDERALELFRDLEHVLGQARALNHLGAHRLSAGDHGQALADCQTALELFGRVGDRFGLAATYDSLGQAQQQLGQHDDAIASLDRSVELLRDLGDRYYEAQALAHLGDAQQDAGRAGAARGTWRRALSILEELEHPEADDVRARLRHDENRR